VTLVIAMDLLMKACCNYVVWNTKRKTHISTDYPILCFPFPSGSSVEYLEGR